MLRASLLAAVAFTLLVPAAANAARPGVTTGAAADISQTTVTLTGRVDPNGKATTYFFQYGTSPLYGAQTAEAAAGSGGSPRTVTAAVGSLAPFTTYHYRVVARNADGLTRGARRTFKTKRQPLGLALGANPAAVAPGGATTLAGNLGGTGNANRQVVLQSNPFPYTQGFLNASNVLVTDAAGNFAFPVLSVPLTTQYRVLMPTNPGVISPIVTVPVLVQVTTHVRRTKLRRGARFRMYGSIQPQSNGAAVRIQQRKRGQWVTVRSTFAKPASGGRSRYYKKFRRRSGGRYRVLVETAGAYASNTSREVTLRVH
jgi:hypothetical protein